MLDLKPSPAPAQADRLTSAAMLSPHQHTLGQFFTLQGVGLHTGVTTTVTVLPAEPGQGRYFVRVDLPEQPIVPAAIMAVGQTMLSTELTSPSGSDRASVRTVEHLLAALVGMGIDNARIEIDGPEVPLLDGSAKLWVEAIAQAGLQPQEVLRQRPVLTEPIWMRHPDSNQDAFVAALPSPQLRFSYGIDFALPAIGNQWHSWSPEATSFAEAVAPARTFGFAPQIEQLRAAGLIKGGSLDNALVCGVEGWINPPLRFNNEPARHKLLDLVGDMSLLGVLPIAHFIAYKASHDLHTKLVRNLTETLNSPSLP